MTHETRIDSYLRELSRALRGFAEPDRHDILQEIRAHLEHRAGEGRLDEALKALGSPQACARGFLEELKLQQAFTDRGPARTFAALFALASQRLTAAVGLLISGTLFLLAAGFAFTAFYELVSISTKRGPRIGLQKGPPGACGSWTGTEELFERVEPARSCGRLGDQARFLNRQDSFPVSTISQ